MGRGQGSPSAGPSGGSPRRKRFSTETGVCRSGTAIQACSSVRSVFRRPVQPISILVGSLLFHPCPLVHVPTSPVLIYTDPSLEGLQLSPIPLLAAQILPRPRPSRHTPLLDRRRGTVSPKSPRRNHTTSSGLGCRSSPMLRGIFSGSPPDNMSGFPIFTM